MRVYTPQLEEHGWSLDAHGGRDRQRRHALPRRLGEHGAQPARERRPPDHPPGRPGPARRRRPLLEVPARTTPRPGLRPRVLHPRRDRPRDRSRAPRAGSRRARARPRGRPGGGRGLAGDGRARPRGRRRPRRAPPPVEAEELAEATALLEWILDDHFTFLGYHEYDLVRENGEDALRRVPGTGLGILRDSDPDPGIVKLGPEAQELAREKTILVLTKANSRATVHRPSYLDYVGVKRFDEAGRGRGRAPLPRPLHVDRLQRAAGRDPAPAPQGPQGARALGPPAGQPRRQGARRDPRDVPARRALPDLGRRPVRDRHGHPPPRRAAARAPLRPPGPVRAASSPASSSCRATASTRRSGARSRRSSRRPSTATASTTTSACRSRCWRGSTT